MLILIPSVLLSLNSIIFDESIFYSAFALEFERSRTLDFKDSSAFETTNNSVTEVSQSSDTITLDGQKGPVTVSFNPLNENISFIEARFKILAESELQSHAGIVWDSGNMSYYVLLRPHRLAAYNSIDKEFLMDRTIQRNLNEWVTLKIQFINDTAIVYFDGNRSSLQFSNSNYSSPGSISNIGIKSVYSLAEFDPMKVGIPLNNATYVFKEGPNIIVGHNSQVIYNDTDSTLGIQEAIDHASTTNAKEVFVSDGRYEIKGRLNFTNDLFFHGEGKNTILDYSNIGERQTILIAAGSRLEDISLEGSMDKTSSYSSHQNFAQKTRASDNVKIRQVWISNLAYGIDLGGARNVTITEIECNNLKNRNDWAACVHAGSGTNNVTISSFRITNSNRGIEVEDGASDITAVNGYLENISNSNNTGHEAFSLDAHSHEGKGGISNITYMDIYLNHSYAPTTKISFIEGLYSVSDLPKNVTFQNITLLNPISEWVVNGDKVTIKDSRILNTTQDVFLINKNSRNILLQNVTAQLLADNSTYISNPSLATGIYNLTIIDNNITSSQDKIGPIINLTSIDRLTLNNNLAIVPDKSEPIKIPDSVNVLACNNLIEYMNKTREVRIREC